MNLEKIEGGCWDLEEFEDLEELRGNPDIKNLREQKEEQRKYKCGGELELNNILECALFFLFFSSFFCATHHLAVTLLVGTLYRSP